MKILNNIVIGGTLLCLPILGFAAPPLVSFEDGTTNTVLVAGDSVEGLATVHPNMNIMSQTTAPAHLGGAPIPVTLIESYNPLAFPPLDNVAYSGPNPLPPADFPDLEPFHLPNACLEDVNGDRVFWPDSAHNTETTGDKLARGFSLVQPHPADGDPANFVHWKYDIEFDEPVKNFFLTMFDFGDFNPFLANEYFAKMTAFDKNGVELTSVQLDFVNDGTSGVISLLLAFIGDACSADDYRGKVFWDSTPGTYDPIIHMHPGYIGGTLEAIGIKKVVVETPPTIDPITGLPLTGDPKVGFDSISFEPHEVCTYTRGYWSNHDWPQDTVITLGDWDYPTVASSDDIFGKANNRDYGQLCAQLAAATLNCQGLYCEASDDIDAANQLLADYDVFCGDPKSKFLDPDADWQRTEARRLSQALDAFNQSNPCGDDEMEYEE